MFILFFTNTKISYAQNSFKEVNSYYYSYDIMFNYAFDKVGSAPVLKQLKGTLISSPVNSIFYASFVSTDTISEEKEGVNTIIEQDTMFKVIKFISDDKLIFDDQNFSARKKQYTDTLYPMVWTLVEAEKVINNVICHKATTQYKGRGYTAWYNPEIPISNGPWKLGGLPGLIVEACDNEDNLKFSLVEFRKSNDVEIKFVNKVSNINWSKFSNYEKYIASGKLFMKKFSEQLKLQSLDCVSCQTESQIQFDNWEKVFN
jgi:GLPGLI family protein